jgi:hypothetical protein
MKPVITTAVLALAAVQAQAAPKRTWFILSGADNECHPAKQVMPMAPTPEAFHRFARSGGLEDEVQVQKDDDGNVTSVMTKLQVQDTTLIWFPDEWKCRIALMVLRQNGAMPSMDDLK